jgi:pimeloyl-ACP methyl ester carboxylesterase
LDFAFAYPDRVVGLIFEAATIFAGWRWQEELPAKAMFEAVRIGGVPAVRQAVLGSALMASVMERPALAGVFTEMVERYSGWHFENRDAARWAEDDAMSRLEEVTAPALVVFGEHDVLDHRLMGEALAERLPNATGHCWPNSGHLPNMEEPEAFNRLVIEFLETL